MAKKITLPETKPKCEIAIDAADIPDHALNQLPVVLRECQRIMGEHGYCYGKLSRGNIGKWALALIREGARLDNFGNADHVINVDKVFFILVTEQPQFTVDSFDQRVLEDEEPTF